ncbi:MAG: histidinol-phosphate transaminase [Cellulosilyticaceae bacterium]
MKMDYRSEINNMMPYIPGKPIDDVKRELGLKYVVKLASNENPMGASPKVKEALVNHFEELAYYPDGNATLLKENVASFYNVAPESLLFGAGSDEILGMIAQVFLKPGEVLLTSEKSFPRYDSAALVMGGKIVKAPMTNYTYDLVAIANAITPETKVIVLANPNNPTGTYFTQDELTTLLTKVPEHILVVLDEAYIEYVDAKDYPDSLPLLATYKNLMLLRTFSKAYGLASLRVGFAIADPEIISLLNRIRNPFNVNALAQVGAIAALNDQAFVNSALQINYSAKHFMYNVLEEMNIPYLKTQANFVMFECPCKAKVVFEKLQFKGYIVRPGFGMPNHIRVTLGTMEQMIGFSKALKEVWSEL